MKYGERKRKNLEANKAKMKAARKDALAHKDETKEILDWLKTQGATESVKYDEDTGRPYRAFTIKI